MFTKNLFYYRALLLNNWFTPVVTIFPFSCSNYNTPLNMTYFCSNDTIEKSTQNIYSMPLICNTVLHGQFYQYFENKDTPFFMAEVYDVSYEFWYCVDIKMYQIPMEHCPLVQCHCDCILWWLQKTVSCHQ